MPPGEDSRTGAHRAAGVERIRNGHADGLQVGAVRMHYAETDILMVCNRHIGRERGTECIRGVRHAERFVVHRERVQPALGFRDADAGPRRNTGHALVRGRQRRNDRQYGVHQWYFMLDAWSAIGMGSSCLWLGAVPLLGPAGRTACSSMFSICPQRPVVCPLQEFAISEST